MRRLDKNIFGVFFRYFLLIISALFNLGVFYLIFTPLTVYPVYWIIKSFFNTTLSGINIHVLYNSIATEIELIPSCIAGSAYFLLFILNMSIPNIKLKKRIKMVILSFLSLLILNILRIVVLGLLLVSGSPLFDVTHKIFWLVLSTIFVVGIWFAEVKICRIREIPVYSDLKLLVDSIKNVKKSKHAKRSKKH
ncbi:MAG: pacearchaeosortase [Candidatus Nanoarchaeia archaeon]|nr:pacearchaeosortase [Candidatus Nanoarchaeia archaeon]